MSPKGPNVLRRFVILCFVGTFVMFSFWAFLEHFAYRPAGDYQTEMGGNRLAEGRYDEALTHFNKALEQMPNHRGALMGRALAYLQSGDFARARAEFDTLIRFLEGSLEPDDRTGTGTLAGAYANRGVMFDRMGEHRKALEDYIMALRTDEGAVSGPGLVDRVVYGTPDVSTVRKRATYLAQQFQLPEEERVLSLPEVDAQQRMHKPLGF